MKRYQWIASTKGPTGHAREHLADGEEDDRDRAIARATEQAARLREGHSTGWVVGVLDRQGWTLSSNPPSLGFELLFIDEG